MGRIVRLQGCERLHCYTVSSLLSQPVFSCYRMVDDGPNIARIDKLTNTTPGNYDISAFTDIDGSMGCNYPAKGSPGADKH